MDESLWDKARKSGWLGTANKANYETEKKGLSLQPWYKGEKKEETPMARALDRSKQAGLGRSGAGGS